MTYLLLIQILDSFIEILNKANEAGVHNVGLLMSISGKILDYGASVVDS